MAVTLKSTRLIKDWAETYMVPRIAFLQDTGVIISIYVQQKITNSNFHFVIF